MKLQYFPGALGAICVLASGLSAQYIATPVVNNFVDISSTGASLGLAGTDDSGASLPIGFSFNFYGTSITSIAATTNGYMTTGTDLTDFSPDCPVPSATEPNGLIAPFFDDLSCVAHGEVLFQTIGTAPNQVLIVQWEDSSTFDSSLASLTFQVQLYEADHSIQFQYGTLVDPSGVFPVAGDTAFIGLEDDTASMATAITCNAGPALLSNASGYRLAAELPAIMAPASAVSGTVFNVPGIADPGTLYVFAWSLSAGPLGPIPLLGGMSLDLGLNFKLAGSGLTPVDGLIASDNIMTPFGYEGTVVNWQAVTIAGFGPISGVKKSNPDTVTIHDGVVFTGSIDSVGVSDHYTLPGTAGDLVTIRHCRTANQPDGSGTLDPYLCLVDPIGVVEMTSDDDAGDCLVLGPFGASEIVDHALLQTGTYTIYASSFQGTTVNDEMGPYQLTIFAAGAQSAQFTVDEGPLCPGQPFMNPASKLNPTLPPLKRR